MKNSIAAVLIATSYFATAQVVDSVKVENLDAVIVQAVRVKEDAPVAHSNLSKEALSNRNLGQDIPVLLQYLPSVVTTTDAGAGVGYTYIRVRGSDASRINVTLNGIPFNDAESQGTFWVNLPDFASSVQSLQLQRGVGTSTNGSGAFGASLNILTDAMAENAGGEIANSFGSFRTRKHTVKFTTGLINDYIELSGRFSNIASNGYIDRAASQLESYFLQAAYNDENTLLKAITFGGREETYQSWFGIDAETLETDRTFNPAGMYTDDNGRIRFYDNEVDNYAQDHYQLLWNQRFDNQWRLNTALNYTYGRGYFEQFQEDANLEFHGIGPIEIGGESITNSDLIRRRWLDNHFYAVNTSINYSHDNWDLTGGAFYSFYDGDHFGEVIWARFAGESNIRDTYYSGNGKKTEFTVFSKVNVQLDELWSIYGDLQGRFINYKTYGLTSDKISLLVDEGYSFFNPKAGVSFKLNSLNQFYGSFGIANREPRRSDFEQDIFTSEKLFDYELGWRYTNKSTSVNTNFYFMNYRDQLVLTGALDDVGAPIRATSGKSYRIGLEIDASIKLGAKFVLQPNIAFSSNKNVDFVSAIDGELVNLGTTNISFSPEIVAGNSFEYKPLKELRIALLSKYVGDQFMGNTDSRVSKLEAYFVHDLNFIYTLEQIPVAKSIVFTALVNNIFNKKYVSNGYFFTYDDDFTNPGTVTTIEGAGYYPQATTNFLLGATIVF